ncbi:endonuclease MutS2 [Ravibacter arvi]|uniref:Endonuclease MutS2 n=1 Tax=Ravibacter arvi TaxID=2051041 RepID=A0ABP8LVJ3_9BACT
MLYPPNIEQKLGFDRIKEVLREHCISSLGREFVDKIRFSESYALIDKLVRQTEEMKRILEQGTGFPSQNYIDIAPYLEKARIEGMLLSAEVFFDIKLCLSTIQLCLDTLRAESSDDFPLLKEFAQNITIDAKVIREIDRVIDERGHVRDHASPELARIRKRLLAEQATVRSRLDSIFRTAKANGWVSDDVSLTIRNGRMVIPVAAEYKRKMKGFVHDASSTGQTVFIEPAEIFESNNEIRELEYEERREINRILVVLTDVVRPHVDDLLRACRFLGLMDFLRAKARFAQSIDAINPKFEDAQLMDWRSARHPILTLSFQKQGKKVTPLQISLSRENRILIISGPNAGGKSVALKTVGLVQYMYQCGLLVPLMEGSSIGLFKNILIDIGDEQSLENDLSTYSSHLTNMKVFLTRANKHTLFLIDEFGTGTEPGLGGAIAESILEELTGTGAFGVINTHYTNLKLFANKTPGLINGAMRFDGQNMQPLYELEMGKPGSSFAFEIASKIGLPRSVVEKAKQKLGRQQVNFEKLIKELDIEKSVFSEKNLELGIKERKLAQQLAEYTALKTSLDNDQKKIRNQAKQEAQALVASANQMIEKTIREIKEKKAEKTSTKAIRAELEKFSAKQLKTEQVIEQPDPKVVIELEAGAITEGSYVRLKDQSAMGQVLSLKGKEAEVRIGALKSTIKLNRLEKISAKAYKAATNEALTENNRQTMNLNEKMMQFSFNLDIRGMRGEEAMVQLDQFMNNALMLGYNELRVVHGKGDGILRTLVRNHLKGYKEVSRMTDEHADRGGAGVTIVALS